MEISFSLETLRSLSAIIFIDLVLAGDNALVIALAARNLPAEHQKKAMLWGILGAITIRIIFTLLVVWLLEIHGLMLCGGLLLLWISYHLITNKKSHEIHAASDLKGAVRTIVVADGAMGIDNVLSIAAIAIGQMSLVIIGLLITIPIIVGGSTLFIKLIEQFPLLIYAGSGILAWTAGGLILEDPIVFKIMESSLANEITWGFKLILTFSTLGLAWRKTRSELLKKIST